MKILKEISTHKAILENGVINIYIKGFGIDDKAPDGSKMWTEEDTKKHPDWFRDEKIDSIPAEEEEDLFAIFEILEENNRCNANELI